jgi:hypothetical protein
VLLLKDLDVRKGSFSFGAFIFTYLGVRPSFRPDLLGRYIILDAVGIGRQDSNAMIDNTRFF